MKVLICGDRDWTDKDAIRREIDRLNLDPKVDIVIHGNARGADKLGALAAYEKGFPAENVRPFPANWNLYGKGAGPRRNRVMLAQNPDLVLAFHSDIQSSKGTKDMVTIARGKGIPVEVFEI